MSGRVWGTPAVSACTRERETGSKSEEWRAGYTEVELTNLQTSPSSAGCTCLPTLTSPWRQRVLTQRLAVEKKVLKRRPLDGSRSVKMTNVKSARSSTCNKRAVTQSNDVTRG